MISRRGRLIGWCVAAESRYRDGEAALKDQYAPGKIFCDSPC